MVASIKSTRACCATVSLRPRSAFNVAAATCRPSKALCNSASVSQSSVVRRSGGADVPDFLAAGARDVLVPAAMADVARDALTPAEGEPPEPS